MNSGLTIRTESIVLAVGYFRGHPPQAGGHGNFRTDDILSHSLASKEQRNGVNNHGS